MRMLAKRQSVFKPGVSFLAEIHWPRPITLWAWLKQTSVAAGNRALLITGNTLSLLNHHRRFT